MACETCHERKVKCDAAKPTCGNCKLRNKECRYRKRKAPPPSVNRTGQYRERLERLERLWEFHGNPSAAPAHNDSSPRILPRAHEDHTNCALPEADTLRNVVFAPDTPNPTPSVSFSAQIVGHRESSTALYPAPGTVSNSASEDSANDSMEALLGQPRSTRSLHDLGSFMIINEGYYDFTGSSSGLSPFMTYDLASASCNIGTKAKSDCLKDEINLCQEALLKMRKGVQRTIEVSAAEMSLSSQSSKPLPPPEIAEEYINLYFLVCQQHFPLLRREQLVASSQENQDASGLDNTSWYTLYNAVLAFGSFLKKKLSGDSCKSAKAESWGYFNNAFNMQPRLLPGRTKLKAVQGFCVLAMLAEHIGTPSLVHRCATFAASLAVGMGLHRAVKSNEKSNLDCDSACDKELVFWIVYFFDKNSSYQMGRPSIIDDEDISCPFPNSMAAQSTDLGTTVEFARQLVRFAYINSKIRKNLYSKAALNREAQDLLPVRDSLSRDVALWRERIPPEYHAKDQPFRIASVPQQVKSSGAILLRVAHANLICSIYKIFAFPLVRHPTMKLDDIESEKSEFEYLQAARELILLLGSLEMEADAPNWFFVYHLLKGMVPIFIHVITNPLKPTAQNDIAIMNVAVGIFGRLELSSAGDLIFPGVNEFPQLAKTIVEKARGIYNCSSEPNAEPLLLGQGGLVNESPYANLLEIPSDSGNTSSVEDFDGPDNIDDFSLEGYSQLHEMCGPFDDLSENFILQSYGTSSL